MALFDVPLLTPGGRRIKTLKQIQAQNLAAERAKVFEQRMRSAAGLGVAEVPSFQGGATDFEEDLRAAWVRPPGEIKGGGAERFPLPGLPVDPGVTVTLDPGEVGNVLTEQLLQTPVAGLKMAGAGLKTAGAGLKEAGKAALGMVTPSAPVHTGGGRFIRAEGISAPEALIKGADIWAESTAEVLAQFKKVATGDFGALEAPTIVTKGINETLSQFGDRPLALQIFLGLATDPLVLFKAFSLPARGSIALYRNLIRTNIAYAATNATPRQRNELLEAVVKKVSQKPALPEGAQVFRGAEAERIATEAAEIARRRAEAAWGRGGRPADPQEGSLLEAVMGQAGQRGTQAAPAAPPEGLLGAGLRQAGRPVDPAASAASVAPAAVPEGGLLGAVLQRGGSGIPIDPPGTSYKAGGGLSAPPPSNRPRTLADLTREAKGIRGMTPESRAAAMDEKKPLGNVIYQVKPYGESASHLLGPDTLVNRAVRNIPGLRQVGEVVSPAQIGRDNPVQMIGVRSAIFKEVERGRARFAGLRWWNDADEFLGFKQKQGVWRATKVTLAPGARTLKRTEGTINDLIEHPERYVMTPDQARVLQMGVETQTQMLRDAQRAGVDAVELSADYWRRIVIKGPRKERLVDSFIRKRVGSRKGYTYQRAFEDIDEGVELGYEYESHPLRTLVARLEAGIDTIADQSSRRELARLPGVETPLERLNAQYPATIEGLSQARSHRDAAKSIFLSRGGNTPANVLALRQAEADYVSALRDLYVAKGSVGKPGFYEMALPNGRIAPRELVEEINKYMDLPELGQDPGALQAAVEASQLARTTLTTMDLASGYIQGQSLFYRNNVSWWKAQAHAVMSLVDDPHAYVARNGDALDAGVLDGAVAPPTEFLFARQGLASIPTKIPVIGPLLRAFNRAFEWFILVGQLELYKAGKSRLARAAKGGNVATEDLASLGTAIRKGMGTESYAILGVRPTQQTIEVLSFFASRFFRANAGILVQTFTAGAGGAEARRMMGSMMAGGLSLLVGSHWALTGRAPNLTDPFAPDWLQVPIGKTYYSPFGPFHPYFRTLARVSEYVVRGEPEKAAREVQRFLSSKASLAIRGAEIGMSLAVTGKARTFDGEEITLSPGSLARGILSEFGTPISVGEITKGLKEGRPESIAEIIGLTGRASPFAQMDILFQRAEDINPGGLSIKDAEPRQQDEMDKRYPELAERRLSAARGTFGKAQRAWADVDVMYYEQGEKLSQDFLSGRTIGEAFRDRYASIQSEKAVAKANVNKTLGLFQEDRDLPDDPNERALVEYYQAQQQAVRGSGEYDFVLAEQLLSTLDSQWTPQQRGYVDRNTGRVTHPPLIQEFREDVTLLAPYWDIEDDFIATLPAEIQSLWLKYRSRDPSEKAVLQGLLVPVIDALSGQRKMYRNEHPDVDVALVRWGYQGSPMTLEGQELSREKFGAISPVSTSAPEVPVSPDVVATRDIYARRKQQTKSRDIYARRKQEVAP
jgi:hypothetical protein